jgi:hypothetical protein
MPSRELLERFLQGFHQTPTVIYDREKGVFVDYLSGNNPIELGQDKIDQMKEATDHDGENLLGS